MKRAIKFGVFGLGRGTQFLESILGNNGEIVAICESVEEKLKDFAEKLGNNVACYRDFDEFINHEGLEAIFLCNTFDKHTPFAIKALEKNIHVLSECASNSTMAEGVALVRVAEKSKAIYMIAENYPFMKFNLEMKRIFERGDLGKLLFAEGEYNHPINPDDTVNIKRLRPYVKHWRNYLPRTYYITHSLGPLMYMTGATPIRVTAMPVFAPANQDSLMGSNVGDRAAIITCLNDDDSVFRVTGCAAFGSHENTYRLCGTKGQAENLRDRSERVMVNYNDWEIPEGGQESCIYMPEWNDPDEALIEQTGHGGSDFLVVREFFDCIRENKRPILDVYCATTMASVGILAHRSLLERGVPYDIPDFRKEEDRVKYENDTLTPFYGSDGSEPTLPCCSHPDYIPSEEDVKRYLEIIGE